MANCCLQMSGLLRMAKSSDLEYVNNISFNMDANIILKTIKSVLKKEGIGGKEDIIGEFKGSVQEYV